MSTINETTTFSIGDLVWKKDILDTYLSIETTMRPILSFDVTNMLFKVSGVYVITENDSTYTAYYNLTPYDTTAPNTGTEDVTEIQNILETNLYSKSAGLSLIDTKYADFTSYINSITWYWTFVYSIALLISYYIM